MVGVWGTVLGCLGILMCETPARARGCPSPTPDGGWSPPEEHAPQEDVVSSFTPFDLGNLPQPRNVALLFRAHTYKPATETTIRAQITVEVSRDGAPVAGSMKPVAGLGTLESLWQWLPDGAPLTPRGRYHVKVTNAGLAQLPPSAPPVREYDIQVVDRDARVPELSLTFNVTRHVVADETAPKIVCANPVFCAEEVQTVALRYLAVPGLTFNVAVPDNIEFPEYLSASARIFARTNGVVVEEHAIGSAYGWTTALRSWGTVDFAKADEYCASVSVWLRTDPEHPTTVEQCQPHGDLDLSMSEEDQQRWLDELLLSCQNPTFPPEYAGPGAPAAPGADEGSRSTSSCAAAPVPSRARDTAPGAVIAIALLAATMWQRRRAREGVGEGLPRRPSSLAHRHLPARQATAIEALDRHARQVP